MRRKTLVLITVLSWLNVGMFYMFYQFQFETVLVGVFREITLLPAFALGVLCPVLLLISFYTKRGPKA